METFTPANSGILLPGGALELPQGGVVSDGDYELVRVRIMGTGSYRTRRSVRVFEHGTHFEWAIDIENDSFVVGGTANTSMRAEGTFLVVDAVNCDAVGFTTRNYGYSGDWQFLRLYFYGTDDLAQRKEVQSAFTYERRCAR